MKIKEICEKTGLTDRTIRYYIEENLISPFYTENYLGRKSFDFSEEDLVRLKEIATLRAFGFSIEEIKDISAGMLNSQEIIGAVKQRTEESLDESQRRLRVLSGLDLSNEASITQLAEQLSNAAPVVENDATTQTPVKAFRSFFRFFAALVAVWLPPLASAIILMLRFTSCREPLVRPMFLALTLVCFLPSLLAILIFNKLKGALRILRYVLMLVCIICLPLSIFFSTNSVLACDHDYVLYRTSVEATCRSEGEAILQCKYCERIKTQITEKLEHTTAIEAGIKATCLSEGLSDRVYCSVCTETLSEQTVLPKSQEHIATPGRGVEPTCVQAGWSDRIYCSLCGITLSGADPIPATGHTFKVRVVSETCSDVGYTKHTCACGYTYITDVVRETGKHTFEQNADLRGYTCRTCKLEVCEYGNADGSQYGGNDLIKYYITGPVSESKTHERTLVIFGEGAMPDFSWETPPMWVSSYYFDQITTIIIENDVTTIGAYAFSASVPNYGPVSYKNVTNMIIRSPHIDPQQCAEDLSGISCKITKDD